MTPQLTADEAIARINTALTEAKKDVLSKNELKTVTYYYDYYHRKLPDAEYKKPQNPRLTYVDRARHQELVAATKSGLSPDVEAQFIVEHIINDFFTIEFLEKSAPIPEYEKLYKPLKDSWRFEEKLNFNIETIQPETVNVPELLTKVDDELEKAGKTKLTKDEKEAIKTGRDKHNQSALAAAYPFKIKLEDKIEPKVDFLTEILDKAAGLGILQRPETPKTQQKPTMSKKRHIELFLAVLIASDNNFALSDAIDTELSKRFTIEGQRMSGGPKVGDGGRA